MNYFNLTTFLASLWETLEICCVVTIISVVGGFLLVHFILKQTHKSLLIPILGLSRFTFTMPPLILVGLFLPLLAVSPVFSFGKSFVILLLLFVFTPYCALKLYEVYETIWSHPWFVHSYCLRLSRLHRFIYCEWPLLETVFVSIIKQVFIFSSLSFSAVILGGGGNVKTLVYHLYQYIETAQFDGGFLLFLGGQTLLTAGIALMCKWLSHQKPSHQRTSHQRPFFKPHIDLKRPWIHNVFTQGLASLMLLVLSLPFMMTALTITAEMDIHCLKSHVLWTVVLSFGLSCFIVVFTFLLASVVMTSTKYQKRFLILRKIAEMCASVPKIIYVGAGLWVLFHLFQYVEESIPLFIFIFFIAYWGYAFIHLSPFWRQFYDQYRQQACFLRLSKWQMMDLCWRHSWSPLLTHLCELAAFIAGNLSITLFLLPDTVPFLSIEIYEAMVNFDVNRASVALINLCFALMFIGALPVVLKTLNPIMAKLKTEHRSKQHEFGV